MTRLCIPFIKIVHAVAMKEFREYAFGKAIALRERRNIQSTIKKRDI
jgi:hypothetical protein